MPEFKDYGQIRPPFDEWEELSDSPGRDFFDAIADQADVDAQAGFFGVYLSVLDYDDEYFTLIDSIEEYRNYGFQYDSGVSFIFKTDDWQNAQNIAEDLHQVILRATCIQEFQNRHGLLLQSDLIKTIQEFHDCRDFSQFHRDWNFDISVWCQAQNLSFNFIDPIGDRQDFSGAQEEVCQELLSNQDFDRLDQLREALKIGKFTFVHPIPKA
jgi:hypothetical protein